MSNIKQIKENLALLNTRNQALLDLANTTTGNNDTNLTDGVVALVGGFGKGGIELPDDMLEGLENGYDVMFYDENNKGLAFYSIKQGHSIHAPVYTCKAWLTENGTGVTFPYTPSEDIIFYANNDTYASMLYEFFDVDSAIYPYVAIDVNTGTFGVKFSKTVSFVSNFMYMYNYLYYNGGFNNSSLDYTNVGDVVSSVMGAKIQSSGTGKPNDFVVLYQDSTRYHYTNFENKTPDNKVAGKYRLDE